jgi:hypothetical protein
MPRKFKDLKLKNKGDQYVMHAEHTDLMAVKRKDRRVFTMLSTAHATLPETQGKPECVHMYNRKMNGVDRSDQMVIKCTYCKVNKRNTCSICDKLFKLYLHIYRNLQIDRHNFP